VAVRTDGAEPRQVTSGEKNRSIVPEWSRDGRFLYHYLFPGGGFSRTPAGGGATEVLIPGWTHMVMHGAHVSPDERRVAYTQMEHSVPVAARVRDLATGAEHALAEPIIWPRWSPDGTTIAGRSRERELMLCPASGEACKGLGVEGTEPRWSGDGQLYFVRYSGYQGSRDARAVPVFRIGPDGKGLTKIAELEGPVAGQLLLRRLADGRDRVGVVRARPPGALDGRLAASIEIGAVAVAGSAP
jgi:hypothetical protein